MAGQNWCAVGLGLLLWASGAGAQQMAITFDDLPAHGDLPPHMSRLGVAQSILATLKKEKMPPVYGFVNATGVTHTPSEFAVLKAWRAAGEPLGNHTFTHADYEKEDAAHFAADAEKNEPVLRSLMGKQDWHWFRYPYLHEGDTEEKYRASHAWLSEHGYRVAEVTMDFEDYLWNDPYARCSKKHDAVALQRLHDTYLDTAKQYMQVARDFSQQLLGRDVRYVLLMHIGAFDAHMLPELLAMYREAGITFVSLPEAESDPVYQEDPDVGYVGGGTLLELMMVKRGIPIPKSTKPYDELEHICR